MKRKGSFAGASAIALGLGFSFICQLPASAQGGGNPIYISVTHRAYNSQTDPPLGPGMQFAYVNVVTLSQPGWSPWGASVYQWMRIDMLTNYHSGSAGPGPDGWTVDGFNGPTGDTADANGTVEDIVSYDTEQDARSEPYHIPKMVYAADPAGWSGYFVYWSPSPYPACNNPFGHVEQYGSL